MDIEQRFHAIIWILIPEAFGISGFKPTIAHINAFCIFRIASILIECRTTRTSTSFAEEVTRFATFIVSSMFCTRTIICDVIFWAIWSCIGHMARRCDVTKDDIWNSKSALTTSNTNIENSVNTIRYLIINLFDEIESHVISAIFNNDDVFEVFSNFSKCIFFFG